MSQEPGRVVAGRYRLLDPLGQGARGPLWRARDEERGREVAVEEVSGPAARAEAAALAAARIVHPGVVAVHDVVADGGRHWVVTEPVRGLTLAEVLAADGPLTPRRAADLGDRLLDALRAAHAAGLVHGELAPDGVLLGNDGGVKVGGFRLPPPADAEDPASDLWALGALLYTAVEGVPPFPGDAPPSGPVAQPPAFRRAGPLAPVLAGLLRTEPAERLTAEEAARLLHEVAAGGPERAPGGPVRTAGAVAPAGGPDPAEPGGATGRAPAPGPAAQGPEGPQAPGAGRRPSRPALTAAAALVLLVALAALAWLLLANR
ncbi:protein kinase [Streptomyces sp. WAC06614]|uniref:protein kinase domain-containing protein n=1 Tax=Streptomyces sp. WAC06614 TaxID=2487416 RepID=UPI00163B9992|nr:protein kinase [Streptomyces sp. WAC06614]